MIYQAPKPKPGQILWTPDNELFPECGDIWENATGRYVEGDTVRPGTSIINKDKTWELILPKMSFKDMQATEFGMKVSVVPPPHLGGVLVLDSGHCRIWFTEGEGQHAKWLPLRTSTSTISKKLVAGESQEAAWLRFSPKNTEALSCIENFYDLKLTHAEKMPNGLDRDPEAMIDDVIEMYCEILMMFGLKRLAKRLKNYPITASW